MLVLGIETSTPQTAVALGTESGLLASTVVAQGIPGDRVLMPAIEQLLVYTSTSLAQVTGIAVGLGPGLFTGMRVGIAAARTLAQALKVPVVGLASLDVLAFPARATKRTICAVIDAKRREVFHALYRSVPGGVSREGGFEVGSPSRLRAELEARAEDVLLVGDGALVYRRELEGAGTHVEFASAVFAHPHASALVELAVPRLQREDYGRLEDVRPIYVRKSDAEIAWDRRRGAD